MLKRRIEPDRADNERPTTLSPRGTRILVVAAIILILVLSYLSAVILIEGARNPAPNPPELQQQPPEP